MATMANGCTLVADTFNHRIRMFSADGKQVRSIAGTGTRVFQDGPAAQATFNVPHDVVVLSDGRILVADYFNDRIRVISADLQQLSLIHI